MNRLKVTIDHLKLNKLLLILSMLILTSSSLAEELGYLEKFPMSDHRSNISKGLPSRSVIPVEYFFKSKYFYRNFGERVIFHGTSLSKATRIIQEQQVIISGNNNIAVNGRGWYFFESLTPAMGYGSPGGPKLDDLGMVLPIKVKKDAVIVNWGLARKDPFYEKMLRENGEFSIETRPDTTFREIVRLGVDVIYFVGEIIVLNQEAVEIPTSLKKVVNFYKSVSLGYEKIGWNGKNEPLELISRIKSKKSCVSLFKSSEN